MISRIQPVGAVRCSPGPTWDRPGPKLVDLLDGLFRLLAGALHPVILGLLLESAQGPHRLPSAIHRHRDRPDDHQAGDHKDRYDERRHCVPVPVNAPQRRTEHDRLHREVDHARDQQRPRSPGRGLEQVRNARPPPPRPLADQELNVVDAGPHLSRACSASEIDTTPASVITGAPDRKHPERFVEHAPKCPTASQVPA